VRTGFSERVAVSVKASARPTANRAWFALVIASGIDAVAAPGKTSGIKATSKTETTSLARTRRFNGHHPNSSGNDARFLGDRASLARPRQSIWFRVSLRITPVRPTT
jgi:hypothetical protein